MNSLLDLAKSLQQASRELQSLSSEISGKESEGLQPLVKLEPLVDFELLTFNEPSSSEENAIESRVRHILGQL